MILYKIWNIGTGLSVILIARVNQCIKCGIAMMCVGNHSQGKCKPRDGAPVVCPAVLVVQSSA